MITKEQRQKKGKKSRAMGSAFEKKVRVDLVEKGWIVDKWGNNIDLKEDKIVQVKPKWNNFTKTMMMNSGGFPDFLCFKIHSKTLKPILYRFIGVESKMNGVLSKEEKEKCVWYLKNNVFSRILIASKEKQGRKVIVKYKEFKNE